MIKHVLHFLARRLDKEEHFLKNFLSTRYGGKRKDTELALNFFKKSILVKETHFPFISVE